MNLLRVLLKPSRGVVALSILAGLVGGGCGVALLAVAQAELARDGAPSPLLGWSFAGLCLAAALARTVAQAAMIRLGQRAVTDLALHLCREVLGLPLARFEAISPAALTTVLTEDVLIVANALAGLPLIAINLPIVAACLIYAGWLSPAALACGLAAAVPAVLGYLALSGRAMRHLRASRGLQDELVGHFRSMIDGFRELKLHRGRREAFVALGLEPAAGAVRDRNVAGLTLYAAAGGWGQLATFGVIGGLLFVLPAVVGLDRAALAGTVLVVLFLMPPLDVLMTWLPILGRARASLLRIEALAPALEASDAEDAPQAKGLDESIGLDGVTYAYRRGGAEGFLLGPIDLTLRRGELVFLVGGNGSGKTTLVKLLCGLYEPADGAILLDGHPVPPGDREAYRGLFSVVFADGHVFPTLSGLDPDADDARAGAHLERLGLAPPVEVRGGRFSTLDLSVGQRRRLALVAACLEDRPACVFDESAAHQDLVFKRFFYREFLPGLKGRGKAVLVISHDEDYFEVADRVLRIDGGLVREAGRVAVGAVRP